MSAGISTRSIGAAIMTTGDDNGLIWGPNVSPVQIVIIPITFSSKTSAGVNNDILKLCHELYELLIPHFRVELDITNVRPGQKYYKWELKGASMRVEVGPRDMKNGTVTVVDRLKNSKIQIDTEDLSVNFVQSTLNNISSMLLSSNINNIRAVKVCNEQEILDATSNNKLMKVSLCDNPECDASVRNKYQLKPICREINIETLEINTTEQSTCIICNNITTFECIISKTF